ncbi:Hermansky-Pudlak syndrome 1 protein homolog isoform X2 [Folsomia candida]|uniref:Hermansky-Pudlak syndrome 1 protein n=1 Tax=Folsomia candida TaxID=158441 RepID=A0A226ERW5_FOLCA|nr:Hermansky-Pudlak syndrome 1 protein homolog isoform X2 [Folsomia candida]OXA60249.1 Hermansky-Pudlak syndrome 1 protein [Folsomia candida]
MKGTLVFDHLNDLIYLNCCPRFVKHVRKLASAQGLVSSEHSQPFGTGKMALDPNVLIQLFSPLVTSQRFMREQFGNPYNSLQCNDGTNIVFQDYMGFLFLRVGNEEVSSLKRSVGITITLVGYLVGPDVSILKSSPSHAKLLDNLLSSWNFLYNSDQAFMIEGISQVKVAQQLNTSLVNSLHAVAGKVQDEVGSSVHTMLFLETKLLSWYSTKNAVNLAPEDLLFLILLCHKTKHQRRTNDVAGPIPKFSMKQKSRGGESSSTTSTDAESSLNLDNVATKQQFSEEDEDDEGDDASNGGGGWDFVDAEDCDDDKVVKYAILLKDKHGNCVPHIAHVGIVQNGLYFVLVSQPPTAPLTTTAISAFQQSILFHNASRDILTDKSSFDRLESTTKRLQELLKKHKNLNLRNELGTRWDRFRTGFQQYLKSKEPITVQAMPLVDIFREIFRIYFNNERFLSPSPPPNESSSGKFFSISKQQQKQSSPPPLSPLDMVWKQIKTDTDDFWGFLRLKTKSSRRSSGNSTRTSLLLESRESLFINKYLEEFPGLVHFIYVDRNKHSVILPVVDFSKEETIKLTKPKIWGMVKFARDHMQQGHFSLMWKDGAFNYAYFLWFEDNSGTSIRPKQPAMPWENYPLPGIMSGDFYQRVIAECFPNNSSKVRCVELFCIHLGLVTSSCVLEHSRRLATNIFDEYIGTNVAMDLL